MTIVQTASIGKGARMGRAAVPIRLAAALALVAAIGSLAFAAPVAAAERSSKAPGPVFLLIESAFEDGSAQALASLVHSDGLLVAGLGERASHYSPSQAVYFFKNLFQAHRTVLFAFRMTQDDAPGGRARGLADWKRRRVDSERVFDAQIVCVLARDGESWRLVELNVIR